MNGFCSVCGQEVLLVDDHETPVIDVHEDSDGHICDGSGNEPIADPDDIAEHR